MYLVHNNAPYMTYLRKKKTSHGMRNLVHMRRLKEKSWWKYPWTRCQSVVRWRCSPRFGSEGRFQPEHAKLLDTWPLDRQRGREMSTPRPCMTDPFPTAKQLGPLNWKKKARYLCFAKFKDLWSNKILLTPKIHLLLQNIFFPIIFQDFKCKYVRIC